MVDEAVFYIEVGKRISLKRQSCRLTQEALASAVGLTRTSITNIERGRQKLSVYALATIAETLRVDCRDLLPDMSAASVVDIDQMIDEMSKEEGDFVRLLMRTVGKDRSNSD
jgi:transcriptional regulator with XRE-family HTH domain